MIRLWLTPLLLLTLPAHVMAFGRDGLWLVLLIASGPLLYLTGCSSFGVAAEELLRAPVARLALALGAALHLWANLAFWGELAREWGLPRWTGVIVATLLLVSCLRWLRESGALSRAFVSLTVILLLFPLAAIMWKTDLSPVRVFREITSGNAFRFRSGGLWVTEGGALPARSPQEWIEFQEEHHLIMVSAGVVRVAFSDGSRRLIEERSLVEGQGLTVRPGDRLQTDPGLRLRFEAGKRIPSAPVNGITWASGGSAPNGQAVAERLGLLMTLFGGAMTLPSFLFAARPRRRVTRLAVALTGSLLLVMAWWGESWGLYATRFAPELYLTGVGSPAMLVLPRLALGGWLGGLCAAMIFAGLLSALLSSVPALLAAFVSCVDREGRRMALSLAAAVGVGVLASLLTVPSWELALVGFGLTSATLAPVMLLGGSPKGSSWALTAGLFTYVALTVLLKLPMGALIPEAMGRYPILVALPISAIALVLRGRP